MHLLQTQRHEFVQNHKICLVKYTSVPLLLRLTKKWHCHSSGRLAVVCVQLMLLLVLMMIVLSLLLLLIALQQLLMMMMLLVLREKGGDKEAA